MLYLNASPSVELRIDKAQVARGIVAGGGEGQNTTPSDSEGSTARSQRSAPANPRYLKGWQNTVNVANKSRDRADLLLSRPQSPQPPPPQPELPAAESGPESSTTPVSPDVEKDNIAKRLVKEVAKVFTKRQQGPRPSEGPVGLADYPFVFNFS